jgi:transaldolase/glucose-6-phosphate isomerase
MGSNKNPLRELERFGVSVWYDNISRSLITTGRLKTLIAEDGLTGVTSNPTIFEKAIGSSIDYDETILRLGREGKSSSEIFESLAIEDIRSACDLFKPVFDATKGADGYVSLELPPALARDAAGSRAEASRLHKLVARANLMIKIPGTAEGVKAFEDATADGIPVNVTLLFAQQRYAEIVEAYLRGLERRVKAGKDLKVIASVASFFVSRVDTLIDKLLESKGAEGKALQGKAAIANAKLAYQIYKKEFGSARWAALKAKGAREQRLLWASTSTKNPDYRDVIYVEELIGRDTVNTMPPATVDAFRDHGRCRPALEDSVQEAAEQWLALGKLGIDTAKAARQLEEEGLAAFSKSFETLLGQIAAKREIVEAEAGVVDGGLAKLERALFSSRMWAKDAALWKKEEGHQKIIKNALGWLTAPDAMAAGLGAVRAFVNEVRAEGFTDAVVLGMGGSSLCCEVFARCFPTEKGYLSLHVLDTTNPGAVQTLTERLPLQKTLFIVASKSGSTIEPNCLMEHFWAAVERVSPGKAGRAFITITDPGTSMEKLARARGFRKIFTNPADVGGRFSALTLFGLVPAALMGVEVDTLLTRARAAARDCAASVPTGKNPGLRLGAALGSHAARGQDKLTLWISPAFETFALWVEQLIAESTGKEGKGIVPVAFEPLRAPSAYGKDRLFVALQLAAQPAPKELGALEQAGHPVYTLHLKDAYDLGAQFFIWEVATAAAGFLLGVDPFDQPDVQSAKDMTKALLGALEGGKLPAEKAPVNAGGLAAFADPELVSALGSRGAGAQLPLAEVLSAHLSRVKDGDYIGVLAYAQPTDDNRRALEALTASLRALSKAPVVLEHGPRYLHSTGQLYKGGAANGVFLELVEEDAAQVPVPGQAFTFGTLFRAQARGDFAATLAAKRRALRLELGPSGHKPLQAVANAAAAAASCRS